MESITSRDVKRMTPIVAVVSLTITLCAYAAREVTPPPDGDVTAVFPPAKEPLLGSMTGGMDFSDSLTTGWGDVLMPLGNTHGFHFFTNIRGAWQDNSQSVYSFGGGVRYLVPGHEIILGANAYYDYIESESANQFSQFGFGLELLTRRFDARFNYYAPNDDTQRANIIPGIFHYESVLNGWDAEAGFLVPWLDRYVDLRILGGGYSYESEVGVDYSGWKARAEVRWTPGIITDVTYWSDEQLNGGHWVAGFRVSLPFDIGNIARRRNPFEGAGEALRFAQKRDFKARLGETVLRSNRIQTAQSSGLYGDLSYFTRRVGGDATGQGSTTAPLGVGVAPIAALVTNASGSIVGAVFGSTLTISGSNTVSNAVTVSAGSLQFGNAAGNIVNNGGATLRLGTGAPVLVRTDPPNASGGDSSITLGGSVSTGTGATIGTIGTLPLNYISGGTLYIGGTTTSSTATGGTSLTLNPGLPGTLVLNAGAIGTINLNPSYVPTSLTVSSTAIRFTPSSQMSLNQLTSGNLILNGQTFQLSSTNTAYQVLLNQGYIQQ